MMKYYKYWICPIQFINNIINLSRFYAIKKEILRALECAMHDYKMAFPFIGNCESS